MQSIINPKKLITFLLIVLGFVTSTFGCISESMDLSVTPSIITATNTFTINEIETPLIIETDETKQIHPVDPTLNPTVINSTPTINIMNKIELPKGFFILTNDLGYELRIVDVGTGATKDLFPEHSLAKFVEWRDNGCQLVVLSEGNLELIKLKW